MKTRAVLFDLDGTLLDTAPDIIEALNAVLLIHKRPILDAQRFRHLATTGVVGLISSAFEMTPEHADYPGLRDLFNEHYGKNLSQKTVFFDGAEDLLNHLDQAKIPWGIVTNKATAFTTPLLTALNLISRTTCVVSGDTVSKAKPHPDPLFHACKLLNVAPADTLFVGDTEVDVFAGKNAGIPTLLARYGYMAPDAPFKTWGAMGEIEHPLDVLKWISASAR